MSPSVHAASINNPAVLVSFHASLKVRLWPCLSLLLVSHHPSSRSFISNLVTVLRSVKYAPIIFALKRTRSQYIRRSLLHGLSHYLKNRDQCLHSLPVKNTIKIWQEFVFLVFCCRISVLNHHDYNVV
jgi:hypothetical protein